MQGRDDLGRLGRRAFIVTGINSGRLSGALDDVLSVLDGKKTECFIYDKTPNNPSLEDVKHAGRAASEWGADFIIGIGGGSPLDTAKAVAVLAVNDTDPIELFKNEFETRPLPIAAIPTTAGTGSEVTPYSILTRDDLRTKMSFRNPALFPVYAYLDPRYTISLGRNVTVNTALDALCHAVEGYVCKRSMPVSDILAAESIRLIGGCLDRLGNMSGEADGHPDLDYQTRETLLYASMLAGMVISQTATTVVHSLGYSLTYFEDIPHGMANGFLLKAYLEFIAADCCGGGGTKVAEVLDLLGVKSLGMLGAAVEKLLGRYRPKNAGAFHEYAMIAQKQRSMYNNIRDVGTNDLIEILEKSSGGGS